VQTIGRAARNINGRVILYADIITGSLDYALNETERRRNKQKEFNTTNNITPKSIKKNVSNILEYENISLKQEITLDPKTNNQSEIQDMIIELEIKMKESASNLEFEEAAKFRDQIKRLENKLLGLR